MKPEKQNAGTEKGREGGNVMERQKCETSREDIKSKGGVKKN